MLENNTRNGPKIQSSEVLVQNFVHAQVQVAHKIINNMHNLYTVQQ